MELIEDENALTVESRMRIGFRVVLGLIGLFPFIAPYELIIKPRWTGYVNVFFLFALIVSLGAVTVGLMFIAGAVVGLDSRASFDRARRIARLSTRAPLLKVRAREYAFDELLGIGIKTHEWSDGPPSYSVEIATRDGKSFSTGSSWERAEVEAIARRIEEFITSPA